MAETRIRYLRAGDGRRDAVFLAGGGEEIPAWLAPRHSQSARPAVARYMLAERVAELVTARGRQVKPHTVMVWSTRYDSAPKAVAELAPPGKGVASGAFPEDSEAGWYKLLESMPGQGGPGTPKSNLRALTDKERAELAAAWEQVPDARSRGRDWRSPEGARTLKMLAALYRDRVRVGELSEVTGLKAVRLQVILRTAGVEANRGPR